jgi:hypothetical protein
LVAEVSRLGGVDHFRDGVVKDRERTLTRIAETSRSTSIRGAALQVILASDLAADMGAALMSRDVHADTDGRECAELDRATEAMSRSAHAALAGLGGALPEIIVDRWMPQDGHAWAALAERGDVRGAD